MISQRFLSDKHITRLLLGEEDVSALEEITDSNTKDNEEVDDAESDTLDNPSDHEDTLGQSSPVLLDNVFEPQIPLDPLAESSVSNSNILTFSQSNIRSQSCHVWATSKATREAGINIVPAARGPTHNVRNIVDPLLLLEQFMTDQIFEEIVQWTNSEIEVKRQNYDQCTTTNDTSKEEIRALIGILVLTAVLKDNHLTLDELFNTENSGTRYVSCMSKERCNFLLRCLRFDNKTFRSQRQKDDPFTPVRDIWEMLMVQCRQNYIPGTNVTIDEQLLAFQGSCEFRMYNPSKPEKCGVKLEMMYDSGTRYMIDSTPYLGKGIDTGGASLREYFVKELTRSIHGTNRIVAMDDRYTSVPLAKQLLQPPYKLKLVGTLQANSTKGGVETFDQIWSVMSCCRKTNRWPMCVFYSMINISCINSYVIYCHNASVMGQKVMIRRDFMKKMHMQLVEPWLKIRLEIRTMPRHIKHIIKDILGAKTDEGQDEGPSTNEAKNIRKRKACELCSYKKRRMTKSYCSKCNTAICGEHKVDFCMKCALK